MNNKSQMDVLVQQARETVAEKGLEASDREVMLAGLSWLAEKLSTNQRRHPQELAFLLATPVGIGSAVAVSVVYALQRLFGF